jgi:hypothetical protein
MMADAGIFSTCSVERCFDMMYGGYPAADSGDDECRLATTPAYQPELPAATRTHTTGHVTHAAPSDLQVVVEDAADKYAESGPPLLVFDFDKTLTDWDARVGVVVAASCTLFCQLKLVMSLAILFAQAACELLGSGRCCMLTMFVRVYH